MSTGQQKPLSKHQTLNEKNLQTKHTHQSSSASNEASSPNQAPPPPRPRIHQPPGYNRQRMPAQKDEQRPGSFCRIEQLSKTRPAATLLGEANGRSRRLPRPPPDKPEDETGVQGTTVSAAAGRRPVLSSVLWGLKGPHHCVRIVGRKEMWWTYSRW